MGIGNAAKLTAVSLTPPLARELIVSWSRTVESFLVAR
jgi:hypothetical protein